MRRKICVPITLVLVIACIPAAGLAQYSQDRNQQQENQSRQSRDQDYRQDDRSSDRDTNHSFRDRREDRIEERGRFDDRDRQDDRFRDDSRRAERRQERRDDRNSPAGLGVVLDMYQDDVEVRDVAPGSPADRAGIRRGDQILAVNGQRINGPEQLAQLVREEDPGSRVDIRIRRDGEQRNLTAELEPLREALGSMDRDIAGRGSRDSQQQDRRRSNESFFDNNPPWSDDELMQHVEQLERQVEAMREQIDDLRSMLSDDPSQRRFSQRRDESRFRD